MTRNAISNIWMDEVWANNILVWSFMPLIIRTWGHASLSPPPGPVLSNELRFIFLIGHSEYSRFLHTVWTVYWFSSVLPMVNPPTENTNKFINSILIFTLYCGFKISAACQEKGGRKGLLWGTFNIIIHLLILWHEW